MRILFFGTFDERAHPRVRALREGLAARGHEITLINEPLGVSTAARVSLLRRPWRAPLLAARIARCWWSLWRKGRGAGADVVVVGYLGHFDVHLARRCFPHAVIVLDHMVSLGDTARDRGIDPSSPVCRLLDAIDRAALRTADIVVVDTSEQQASLPIRPFRVVVAPVTAPTAWLEVAPAPAPQAGDPVRVVFFGLFTPLQGTLTIGKAIALLADDERITITMIGRGQDLVAARRLAEPNQRVHWIDWVSSEDLPAVVASHHVCLGIFGESSKAQRVVPNKVVQGAAAGCAIVTSDTAVQRQTLGEAACFVPAGRPEALASALRQLVEDRTRLVDLRARSIQLVREHHTPEQAVSELEDVLLQLRRSTEVA